MLFLPHIFEFEYVSSALPLGRHLLLRRRSFVFGASQPCRPPVDLLFGLKAKHNKYFKIQTEILTGNNEFVYYLFNIFINGFIFSLINGTINCVLNNLFMYLFARFIDW